MKRMIAQGNGGVRIFYARAFPRGKYVYHSSYVILLSLAHSVTSIDPAQCGSVQYVPRMEA